MRFLFFFFDRVVYDLRKLLGLFYRNYSLNCPKRIIGFCFEFFYIKFCIFEVSRLRGFLDVTEFPKKKKKVIITESSSHIEI